MWILQGTFVASRFHLCFILYCLDFFQPVTMRRFYFQEYWEFNLRICLFFFVLCVFFPKLPLSLKGHFFLLIVFRSFYHEEEQEGGIHSPVDFHVLNLISGSCSYSPCQAQFGISPEAWGRGPSRRRLILLALSLLREINALCNIWRSMPSTPLVERQKNLPGGLRALK